MPGLYPTNTPRSRSGTFRGTGSLGNPGTRGGYEGNYPRYYRSPGRSTVPRVNKSSQAQMQRAMLGKFSELMINRYGGNLMRAMMFGAAQLGLNENMIMDRTGGNPDYNSAYDDMVSAGGHPELEGYTYGGKHSLNPTNFPYEWGWADLPGPGKYDTPHQIIPHPPESGDAMPNSVSLGPKGKTGVFAGWVYSLWWYTRNAPGNFPKAITGEGIETAAWKPRPQSRKGVGNRTYGHPWMRSIYPETLDVYEPQPQPVPMPYKMLPVRPNTSPGVGTERGYGEPRPSRPTTEPALRVSQTGAKSSPATRMPSVRRPPKKREKEAKFVMSLYSGSRLGIALGLITEGMDIVSALYRSLPKSMRPNKRFVTMQDKAKAVWEHGPEAFQQNPGKFVEEIFKSMANDAAYGMIGRATGQAQRNAYNETGASVNGINHLFGSIGEAHGEAQKMAPPK